MFYIIPSWDTQTLNIDYDYLLNKMLMFEEEGVPYLIMGETFNPMLTLQLNKFGLINAKVWQAFDEIQNVHLTVGKPLSFEDIPMPSQVEQVYSPYGISLMGDDHLVAFAEMFAGIVLQKITYYRDDDNQTIDHVDIFDGRGFLSRRYLFDAGQVRLIKLYNPFGEVVLTVDETQNGLVTIYQSHHFAKDHYASLTELVIEVSRRFLWKADGNAKIISAVDDQFSTLTAAIQLNHPVCNVITDTSPDDEIKKALTLSSSPKVLAPSEQRLAKITAFCHDLELTDVHSKFVPPYPTEFDLGISNSLATQIIFWHVEQMDHKRATRLAETLVKLVVDSEDKELLVNAVDQPTYEVIHKAVIQWIERQFDVSVNSEELAWVRTYLEARSNHQLTKDMIKEAKKRSHQENWQNLIDATLALAKLHFDKNHQMSFYDESLKRARLLVDLSPTPSPYLQTKAISFGIPQINAIATSFVTDKKNGIILKKDRKLDRAVNYFLDTLDNWNLAVVEDVKKMGEFSKSTLVSQINAIFEEGEA
ncbi:accessory Sec system protein Asp1 [Lentilactobacillus raoultii]|uniref:Accessory Sec system protein Asp1 n=1 Tax=Lentilactobacillus raoultii TaxID=1987503 RepID=A0ABW3PL94_9LACO|nr:accessory Sec system protein Asp1 [Lentilactobacillus raoultii]